MYLNDLYHQAQTELRRGETQLAAATIQLAARELAAIGVALGASPDVEVEITAGITVSKVKRKLDRSEIDADQFRDAQAMLQTLIDQVAARCAEIESERSRLRKRRKVVNTFQSAVPTGAKLLDLSR